MRFARIFAVVLVLAAAVAWFRWDSSDFRLSPPAESGAKMPDFHLTDFNGRKHSLADYRGRVVAIFFGFTRCPAACPAELFKLQQVMKRLGADASNVQILFITLDPERDSPELMRSYLAGYDSRFVGLTGTMEQIYGAAQGFGVVHVKLPIGSDYVIDHSIETHVIDPEQRRWLIGSAKVSIDDLEHDIRELLDRPRATS